MSACVAALFFACTAFAQEYPNKPIRMIAPQAGSGADFLARLVAQAISSGMQQQVIVENRGGNVIVPIELLVKAPADGYTLLFFSNALWVAPFLQSVRFDPLKDMSPVTLAMSTPAVLAVHPSLPVKSVADLIALAKRRPGEINYAAGGFGSANHLAGELFKSMAGINLLYIPYGGSAAVIPALLGGQVSAIFTTFSSAIPHMKVGRLRVLGITSPKPSELAPGVPAIAETVPGYEASVKFAVFAPARTPGSIIDQLSGEISRYVRSAQGKDHLIKAGAEPAGISGQELVTLIRTDMTVMSKLIKETGITVK